MIDIRSIVADKNLVAWRVTEICAVTDVLKCVRVREEYVTGAEHLWMSRSEVKEVVTEISRETRLNDGDLIMVTPRAQEFWINRCQWSPRAYAVGAFRYTSRSRIDVNATVDVNAVFRVRDMIIDSAVSIESLSMPVPEELRMCFPANTELVCDFYLRVPLDVAIRILEEEPPEEQNEYTTFEEAPVKDDVKAIDIEGHRHYQTKFGIEIEGVFEIGPSTLTSLLRKKGLKAVKDESTTSSFTDRWKVTGDASIGESFYGSPSCDSCDERHDCYRDHDECDYSLRYGLEIVSPPLKGEDGIKQVLLLYEALDEVEWEVGEACGLHVHIEDKLEEPEQYAYLIKAMFLLEKEIIRTQPTARRNSRYCQPIDTSLLIDIGYMSRDVLKFISKDVVKKAYYRRQDPFTEDKYNEARYRGLNLHSVWYRGTVEFRYFETPKDLETCLMWISFCQNVMYYSRKKDYMRLAKYYHAQDISAENEALGEYFINKMYREYVPTMSGTLQRFQVQEDRIVQAFEFVRNNLREMSPSYQYHSLSEDSAAVGRDLYIHAPAPVVGAISSVLRTDDIMSQGGEYEDNSDGLEFLEALTCER